MTRTATRRAAIAALATLGLGAALTVFAPFASAQSVADIKKKGEITIGMLVDFPPYGTTDASSCSSRLLRPGLRRSTFGPMTRPTTFQ
jgi:polar amino acid transport system substrate-binding protein